MIQAAKTRWLCPAAGHVAGDWRKIPVPIVSAITIAVADHRPRPRIKFRSFGLFCSDWDRSRSQRLTEPTIRNSDGSMHTSPVTWRAASSLRVLWPESLFTRYPSRRNGLRNKSMLSEFAWTSAIEFPLSMSAIHPALLLYFQKSLPPTSRRHLELLGGDANRWPAVHIKTASLASTLRMLVEHGIRRVSQCADHSRIASGLPQRRGRCTLRFPQLAPMSAGQGIAVSVPRSAHLPSWRRNNQQVAAMARGSRVGVFLDWNPGMDRTGIEQKSQRRRLLNYGRAIRRPGDRSYRGLHY